MSRTHSCCLGCSSHGNWFFASEEQVAVQAGSLQPIAAEHRARLQELRSPASSEQRWSLFGRLWKGSE